MSGDQRTQTWFIAGGVVLGTILVIAGAVYFDSQNSAQSDFKATTTAPIDAADHVHGDATSTVSVIEYGDFECPACGAWEPLVEQLFATYGNRVSFVFRNFPLPQHMDAMVAAEAAEAAGIQGKYWQMHDLLYAKQNEWSTIAPADVTAKYFDSYAQSLGLDVAKFNADMTASSTQARIQRDMTSGNNAMIDHTPTFFVNLTQIPNPTSYASFTATLDAALAASSK
jgi:protein-disulfide isomerase